MAYVYKDLKGTSSVIFPTPHPSVWSLSRIAPLNPLHKGKNHEHDPLKPNIPRAYLVIWAFSKIGAHPVIPQTD